LECLDSKPASQEACVDDGDHCSRCRVELFGNGDFSGWRATFTPGEYDTDAMIARGAKCEEVSAVKVKGECCHAFLYQYGDFNNRNKGWSAHLKHGDYDSMELEDMGVQDNDASSLRVEMDEDCKKATRTSVKEYHSKHHHRRSSSRQLRPKVKQEQPQQQRDPMAGVVEGLASSASDPDSAPRKSSSPESQSDDAAEKRPQGGYAWWFWILVGILVVAVVSGVFIAMRRRANV
jgi:cobalamin biosynthesis Mg chelatase CobN